MTDKIQAEFIKMIDKIDRWTITPIETTDGRYSNKELGLSFNIDKKGSWIKVEELKKELQKLGELKT